MRELLAPENESLIRFLTVGANIVRGQRETSIFPPKTEENNLQGFSFEKIVLDVHNVEKMSEFYENVLGFTVNSNCLSRAGKEIIEFKERPALQLKTPRSPGLFHYALEFDSYASLASTLTRVLYWTPENYHGGSDDGFSTNFYFSDVEGNGVKLFVRHAEKSEWYDDGTAVIKYSDVSFKNFLENSIDENIEKNWKDQPVSIGHVHLQVPDLRPHKTFWSDVIGLVPTLSLPSVTYLGAADNYQLISLNTWNAHNEPVRHFTGLSGFVCNLTTDTDRKALEERLSLSGTNLTAETPHSFSFSDLLGVHITVQTRG